MLTYSKQSHSVQNARIKELYTMEKRIFLPFLILISSPLFAQNSFAQDQIVLKTEFQDTSPKSMLGQDGKFTGLCLDIIDLIEKKTNIKFSYPNAYVPSKRIEANQVNGVTDIHFGRAITPERQKILTFGEKLYDVTYQTVARKDDKVNFKSISDLAKLGEQGIVLSLLGIATSSNLKKIPGLRVDDQAADVETNLEKLAAGRGRVFIYHNLGVGYALQKKEFKNKFKIVPLDFENHAFLEDASHYVIFSKKVPAEVIEKINKVIRETRDKEIEAILDKYLVK